MSSTSTLRKTRVIARHVVFNDSEKEFSLSDEALKWLGERGVSRAFDILDEILPNRGNLPIDNTMIGMNRHDALLVLCIESLGKKASTSGSLLRIQTIYCNRYIIRKFGNIETVLTPNDLKWITIE